MVLKVRPVKIFGGCKFFLLLHRRHEMLHPDAPSGLLRCSDARKKGVGANFFCSDFRPASLVVMRIDPHRHVWCGVPGEVLNLLHVKTGFDPACDAGVAKQVWVYVKVQRVDDVRVPG